jgi:XRE family aerobic/anaerobic benzoate catabolism transcriptional regulator
VAQALHCPLSELIGDTDSASPEWLLTRDLLQRLSEPELRRARIALSQMFGQRGDTNAHSQRVALIGLRGAGKSTLGQMLADDLDCAFIELSREIERIAGCTIREIHDLYGTPAYRRYERQALEAAIRDYDRVVIAAPGGIVSDPESFNQLLAHCLTVWLQAEPEDHMRRVTAQGDLRPMAASDQALDDLRRILNGRTPLYARANLALDTGAQALEPTLHALRAQVRAALGLER